MGDFELVKISDIASYRKEFIEISDEETYKRCRVQLHKRGVILRDVIKGSDIKTKKQRLCKKDDFIVAEMDAKFGGYGIVPEDLDNAIVSSHYYLFSLDNDKILPDFLKVLIDTEIIQSQIKAKGSTNYSRVSPTEVLNFEIPCPSIKSQQDIIKYYLNSKKIIAKFLDEVESQHTLLTRLRQAILQEAVEGKLTADWRKQHPELISGEHHAARLLEKLKAEKAALSKSTKGTRKTKELPPISEEEKPFDLPEGWVWCRLGEVAYFFQYGSSKKSNKEGKVPVLRMGNLVNGFIDWSSLAYTSDESEITKYLLQKYDLLFNRTNSRELVGKTALFDSERKAIYAGYLVRFRMLGSISSHYTNFVMNSTLHRNWCDEVKTDALGQSNINATKLTYFRFPLPPLPEQHAIVEKVERLLALVDALEQQVQTRKTQAGQLMQAVLREAFNGDTTPQDLENNHQIKNPQPDTKDTALDRCAGPMEES